MAQSQTSEQEILAELADPVVFLEALTELDGAPFRLEPYQIRFIRDRSIFRIINKGRQIGMSTAIAGEELATAVTRSGFNSNIVSINQKEASQKIEIIRALYHSIPDELKESGVKPALWTDAANEISFHRPPKTSTIVSQPASAAVRGGRKDIVFDEFAHIRDAAKLWQAALPAITRGNSRLTIISTPLGQSGLFYDIFTDESNFPEFSRHSVPWWESAAMVDPKWVDPETGWVRPEVFVLAPGMGTEERVKEFGSQKLQVIYRNVGDKLSFMTEYEAVFVDETTSYYPWQLIIDNIDHDLPVWREIPPTWEPEGIVSIGVDLAKERDETVFTVIEHREVPQRGVAIPDDATDEEKAAIPMVTHRYVRHLVATQQDYDEQMRRLMALAKRVNASRVTIDQTGVGQVFTEEAKKKAHIEVPGCRFEGVVFTNQTKEQWATRFKGDLQLNAVHLLNHPQLKRQVHAIQRTKTESNFYKFSAPRDDYFWSLMLGLYGEGRVPSRITVLGGPRG